MKVFSVIFFSLQIYLFSQIFPDYKERNIIGINDTLVSRPFTVEASEGSIDPKEYKVGPGDKLFIAVHGFEEQSITVVVNQEGIIYIPKSGSVDLNNLTLIEAKGKIVQKLNQNFKNVDIFVSLIDFRQMRVSILGNVLHPSSYTIKGYGRLSDIVLYGGLTSTSNYRSIKITNREGDSKTYDYLAYLRFGNRDNNPLLREGDIVLVDKVDKLVYINGLVKYPGGYEYVENETVKGLISLAGGLLYKAKTDSIEIVSFTPDGKTETSRYFSLEEINNKDIKLNIQDHILIREKSKYFEDNFVYVQGFVNHPGYYKIVEDKTTLREIIAEAGGFKKDGSLKDASLYRNSGVIETDQEYERLKLIPRADLTEDEYDYLKSKSRQKKGNVVVDFEALFLKNKTSEDIVLRRNDVINVPEKKDYIIMLGQVVNPGNIIYDPNLNYEDYINLAGGFSWRALKGDVRVVKAKTGEWIDADKVKRLEPGDAIWVPEDPPNPRFWTVFTTTLNILGQTASIVAAVIAVIVATRK